MPNTVFRVLAVCAALSAWLLVAVGGVVRVTESGLGCPDWPLCSGRIVPHLQTAPVIEFSHRLTTTVVTALVLACAAYAWKRLRDRPDIRRFAIFAALLLPVQALLGALVVLTETPPWLVAFHFVVGMLFLGCTVVVATRAVAAPSTVPPSLAWAAWAGVGAALALVVAGVSVVASGAEEACGRQWPSCHGSALAHGGLELVQITHRGLAYAVALIVAGLVTSSMRSGILRAPTTVVALAVLTQGALGVSLVLTRDHTPLHAAIEIAHVAGAGAVWALLVSVVARIHIEGTPGRGIDQPHSIPSPTG